MIDTSHHDFQYYLPDQHEEILRYDNAHDSDVGPHHRHEGDETTGLEFIDLQTHVARFQSEVLDNNARP